MPYEIAADEAIVVATARPRSERSAWSRGARGSTRGSTRATLTVLGGIPAIGLGPGGLGRDGAPVAHTVDEHVPVDDLVATAQAARRRGAPLLRHRDLTRPAPPPATVASCGSGCLSFGRCSP